MKLSRAQLLAGGAAAGAFASIGILRWPGDAAQFVFKLGNDQTATHPMNVATADAIKRITDASNGQLEVRLFAQNALGSDTDMLAQLRSGGTEMMQVGSNILSAVLPSATLLSIPFAFHSAEQYQGAMDGPVGAFIGAAGAKIGIRMFPHSFYGGFFELQNRVRPIEKPTDLIGLKIRVPAGPIDVATFRALGATPTPIDLHEVYTSLQTHLVDGIEVPLPTVRNFKFYEQVKYCTMTNHIGLAYMLFVNADAWQRLPKPLQEILERELGAAALAGSKAMMAQEISIAGELTADGMIFNRPNPEPFAQAIRSAGLYKQWRDQNDPKGWEALEKTTGKLI
jgi:tripartite ATP-independent transporter DctP family solute receptor